MIETQVILRSIYKKTLEAKSVEEIQDWMRSIMSAEDVAIVENSGRGKGDK